MNAKRVYRVICDNNLLLERKGTPVPARVHHGKVAVSESDRRWCSDGFEFNCDNDDKLRVTFSLDCCDREALGWIATNGGYISVMPKPDREVALINLAIPFEHYNDRHPHSALGYSSPREYRRQRDSLT